MKKNIKLIFTTILSLIPIFLSWSQGFKVSGNQLLDANGNNFVMKGINIPLAWFVNDVNNNIANLKTNTGSNCFRIVVNTTTSDADWQACVQKCIDNKVIPMVELHDVTGNNSPAELNRMAQFWAAKASYLTKPEIAKYILINIANEWSDWFMSATATGTISRVTWKDAYITAVKTIRDAGIKTTLVIDAAGYGQDNKAQTILEYAKAVQASDPYTNCLFSIHMYCEWAVGGNSSISLLPSIKSAGIPIIVGEFGWQHADGSSVCDIDENLIISTSNTNNIGWLAWSLKGNGGGVEYLDLSTDWTATNLSSWGKTVINGTGGTKTAVNASVFTTTPNIAPTVSITAPTNNASFTAPATINITATASDTDGTVSKVEFYNGSTLLNTDTTSPYTYSWTSVAAGTYTLTAKATDNAGAVTTSAAITVTVTAAANVAPTVSITAPTNNASFTAPATISLTATAADSDGTVSKVEFYNGSTLLNTDTTSPYTYSWGSVAAGTYTITAKATDNVGEVTTSTAITVAVTGTTTTNNCAYGTPSTAALATINKSFSKVYKLGSGGPSLTNLTNFSINWDLAANGLWQMSFSTNNGVPGWWFDLRTVSTNKFNQASPEVTFTNSGFAGLDGSYWVTIDNGNFVMVSKTGGFTLYFSNSVTAPTCSTTTTKKMIDNGISNVDSSNNNVTLYPNPFNNVLNIKVNKLETIVDIQLFNQIGNLVLTVPKHKIGHENQIENILPTGLYLLKVNYIDTVETFKIVKR